MTRRSDRADFYVAQVHECIIWWQHCICLEISELAPFYVVVREIFQDNGFRDSSLSELYHRAQVSSGRCILFVR
jgi:hypothetical protein